MVDKDKRNESEREGQEQEERPIASSPVPPVSGGCRDALDADDLPVLKGNPSDRDARLDINIDESFPASDPPAITQPRRSNDPPPGGKYD